MPDWLQYFVPRTEFGEGWILAVAVMTNVACGVIGCYLVLRRMSLMGDAISHAVLPGLVIAFLFTGSLNIGGMLVGAFLVGLLTTFLTQALHRQGGVPADASMGVVFTSLFAIGVVLLRRYAGNVDLDPDCVLQGQLTLLPGIQINVLGYQIPRAALSIGSVLVLNVIFVLLLWKELKITSFDPALATTMGLRSGLVHYLLMAMVAATSVAAFEAVGSILVIAMLIVPAATAHLLTDRLDRMLWIAAAVGALSAYLGFVAARFNEHAEPAGMIAVAGGLLFLLAVFFSPRYGIVSTLLRNVQTTSRIVREDILALLYRLEELGVRRQMGPREATQAVGGGMAATIALWRLFRLGLVERAEGGLRLTANGRERAVHLVRSHRLWEAYLVEYLGLPLDHVHGPAERMEHYIGEKLQQKIAQDLPQEAIDPHGREIPR
jgi:manganese/zinc/iron transport system permease protein